MNRKSMDNTNVMVEFRISGDDYDPAVISNILAIQPSESWKKGDKIRNTIKEREYTGWVMSTGYEESLDINIQLSKMINLLRTKEDCLLNIKDKYSLKYRFDIVINIEKQQVPAIYLDTDAISFSNKIGIEYDFDMYIYS